LICATIVVNKDEYIIYDTRVISVLD